MEESRLKWYGYDVIRREERYVGKSVMMKDVSGEKK